MKTPRWLHYITLLGLLTAVLCGPVAASCNIAPASHTAPITFGGGNGNDGQEGHGG